MKIQLRVPLEHYSSFDYSLHLGYTYAIQLYGKLYSYIVNDDVVLLSHSCTVLL